MQKNQEGFIEKNIEDIAGLNFHEFLDQNFFYILIITQNI